MNLNHTDQAVKCVDQAEFCLEAGMVEQASLHVNEALRLNPDHPHARLLHARVSLHLGQPSHAVRALSADHHLQSELMSSPERLYVQAKALARGDKPELALRSALQLAREYPDDPRGHRLLAGVQAELNDMDAASESMREVLRLTPTDRPARRMLAEWLQQNQPEEAIQLLIEDYRVSHSSEILLRLMRLYRSVGRLRDAEEAAQVLLTREAHEPGLWHETGVLALELGSLSLAQQRLEQSLTLADSLEVALQLAQVHLRAGRFAQGAWILFKRVRQGHTTPQAVCGLIVATLACGRLSLTRHLIRRYAHSISRSERRAHCAAWWVIAANGRSLRLALGDSPDTQEPINASNGLMYHAATVLRKQVEHHPQRADAHYHFAVTASATGDRAAAIQSLKHALQINPRYTTAKRLLARISPGDAVNLERKAA